MLNFKPVLAGLLVLMSAAGAYAAAPANDGRIIVADARDVVRDESNGTVVRSSSGECVRTRWLNDHDVCSTAVPVPHHVVAQIEREARTVYFGFNQASLSPEMKARLDSLAANMKSEEAVRGAKIVGFADRIGNPKYNEKLSQKRAETVHKYLVSKGIINTTVGETRWVGENEPATSCPNDLKRPQLITCLQKDRRVEVEIDYAPEVQATR